MLITSRPRPTPSLNPRPSNSDKGFHNAKRARNTGGFDNFLRYSNSKVDKLLRLMSRDIEVLGVSEWTATLRVYNLAVRICREEGGNLEIVAPSALLHDLGKAYEDSEGVPHQVAGERRKKWLLKRAGYSPSQIRRILHTIRFHQKKVTRRTSMLEARILQDADNVDEVGLIGFLRSVVWHTKRGDPIYLLDSFEKPRSRRPEIYAASPSVVDHLNEKLLALDRFLNTNAAKRLAKERIKTMENTLRILKREILARE